MRRRTVIVGMPRGIPTIAGYEPPDSQFSHGKQVVSPPASTVELSTREAGVTAALSATANSLKVTKSVSRVRFVMVL